MVRLELNKTKLPSDHLGDRTGRSNRLRGCQDLLQQRPCREEFQFRHYKIGKMLSFAWFAFAYPGENI